MNEPTATTPGSDAPPTPPAGHPVGLRLRLWTASFAGALVACAGGLWVLGTQWQPGEGDLTPVFNALVVVAAGSLLAGFAAALWLDHHVVSQLRGVLLGLRTGRVAAMRGLPAASGWGELSELSEAVTQVLSRQRQGQRAVEELESNREQLEALRHSLERWLDTERWRGPGLESGGVAALESTLARGFGRAEAVGEQHRDVARQIAGDLVSTLADAQESAEQAERGFVEATALLTTIRELQRLSLELQNALAQIPAPPPESVAVAADDRFRASARAALEELVSASSDSVAGISSSLMHVQEIAESVQRLANRSTLIAIHAVVGGARTGDEALAGELRQLAVDVRQATERTSDLAREIESEVGRAGERMRGVRARALARLDEVPAPAESAPERRPAHERRAWDDSVRLLERVREMVQDGAKKGERLSAAGERASRAAERLARRLEEGTREAEALAVRLEPVGDGEPVPTPEATPGLHVIESEEMGEDPAAEPGAGSRPEESR